MAIPAVTVNQIITTLSASSVANDGIALLVTNPPVGYTVASGNLIFNSLENAEAALITEAKDLTHTFLLWEHIKDFYLRSPGAELHVLIVPQATTMTQLFTPANANYTLLKNYLALRSGDIKQIGVSIKGATESNTTSTTADLLSAIPLAHAFAGLEYTDQRPVEIFFEGRNFQGTAANATNLTLLNSGSVAIVVARDKARREVLVTAGHTDVKFAQIGLFMGSVARVAVSTNIGKVSTEELPIVNPEFSGSQQINVDFNASDINVINNKGYIFYTNYPTKAGRFYYQNDPTCTVETASNARINLNRVINKATRIVIAVYINSLKSSFQTTPAGTLLPSIILALETQLKSAVERVMLNNPDQTRERELSVVTVKIDPTQKVLTTKTIIANITIIPLSIAEQLVANISLVNPSL